MAGKEKTTMSQRFAGLKSEFSKIVWPEPKTIGKQSAAVIVVSIVVGLIIVVLDMIIQYGGEFLVNL